MDQGLVAQAREGTWAGLWWEREIDGGSGWWATLSMHPSAMGPTVPSVGSDVEAQGARVTDRVSHQPRAPALFGGSAVRRSPESPR